MTQESKMSDRELVEGLYAAPQGTPEDVEALTDRAANRLKALSNGWDEVRLALKAIATHNLPKSGRDPKHIVMARIARDTLDTIAQSAECQLDRTQAAEREVERLREALEDIAAGIAAEPDAGMTAQEALASQTEQPAEDTVGPDGVDEETGEWITHDAKAANDPIYALIYGREGEPDQGFARALYDKLQRSEKKYGWRHGWLGTGWADDLRKSLVEHLYKGDPRDIAAYCAFAWWHGWSVAPEQSADTGATVRVPREPTEAMVEAAKYALDDAYNGVKESPDEGPVIIAVYCAMVDAASREGE